MQRLECMAYMMFGQLYVGIHKSAFFQVILKWQNKKTIIRRKMWTKHMGEPFISSLFKPNWERGRTQCRCVALSDWNITSIIGLITVWFNKAPSSSPENEAYCLGMELKARLSFNLISSVFYLELNLLAVFAFCLSSRFTLAVCSPSQLSCWPVSRDDRTSRRSVWPANPKASMLHRHRCCFRCRRCSRAPTKVSLYHAGSDVRIAA